MSDPVKTPLEQIAHHEAAHYVAAYVLRPDATRYGVTIVPDGTYLGRSDSDDSGTFNEDGEEMITADETGAMLIELYAGWAAQHRYAPDASSDSRAGDDLQAITWLYLLESESALNEEPALHAKYDWMGTPQAEAAEARWRTRADDFVAQHWATIEALASELLKHGRLDATEADMVCALARGEPDATAEDLALYRQRRRALMDRMAKRRE